MIHSKKTKHAEDRTARHKLKLTTDDFLHIEDRGRTKDREKMGMGQTLFTKKMNECIPPKLVHNILCDALNSKRKFFMTVADN